jgi:hypothetical protein
VDARSTDRARGREEALDPLARQALLMGAGQELGLPVQEIDLAVERRRADPGDFADPAQRHLVHEQPQDELIVENAPMPACSAGRRRKGSSTGLALPAHRTRLVVAVPMIEIAVFGNALSIIAAACLWARWTNLARLMAKKRCRQALELFGDAGVRLYGNPLSTPAA